MRPRRQPASPVPDLGAGPATARRGGGPATRSATSAAARLAGAPAGVSSAAFVPRPAATTFGTRRRDGRDPGAGPAGAARPPARRARRGLRASWSTTRRPMPAPPRRSPSATAPGSSGWRATCGPAAARNAGLAARAHAVRRLRRLRLRALRRWLGPLLGHFDDPVVAAVAPRVVPRRRRGRRARSPATRRSRSSLDRGPRRGSCAGGPIPYVPSAALVVRATWRPGPTLFDATLRGGEDVDLVWRLAEAGWDVRYVPAEHRRARRAGDASAPSWRAAPSTGRRPHRWPGATRTPSRPSTSRRGRWRCGRFCWPAGPCSRWRPWRRPSASWPAG